MWTSCRPDMHRQGGIPYLGLNTLLAVNPVGSELATMPESADLGSPQSVGGHARSQVISSDLALGSGRCGPGKVSELSFPASLPLP